MDALSQTLRVVRLVGAIFLHGRFTAPWCYQSPHADAAAPFLEPTAERVIIFHLITEGECWVELGDQPPLRLAAGDAVLFPQGDAHRIGIQEVGGGGQAIAQSADALKRKPGRFGLLQQLGNPGAREPHRGGEVFAGVEGAVRKLAQ